jgi:hypothetical protein
MLIWKSAQSLAVFAIQKFNPRICRPRERAK